MQRYQGIHTITEKNGQHCAEIDGHYLNLDGVAYNKALAALPKEPLPYAGKGVKGIPIDNPTPEEISAFVDSMFPRV